MSTYTISIAGGPALDAESNSIGLLTRTEANQGGGTITLAVIRTASQPFLIQPRQQVTIYQDDAIIWQGVCGKCSKQQTADGFRHTHEIHDPWRVCLESNWRFPSDPTTNGLGTFYGAPSVWAYTSSLWTMLQTWAAPVIGQYLTIDNWPNACPQIVYGLNNWQLPPGGALAAQINLVMRPFILGATYFDHSTTPPTLRVTSQGLRVVNLDASRFGINVQDMAQRTDLAPTCVELWQATQDGTSLANAAQAPFNNIASYPALYPSTAARGQFGGAFIQNTFSIQQIDAGAPKLLFDLLNNPGGYGPLWEGSFTVHPAAGVAMPLIQPGTSINLTGSPDFDPAWATMYAVVQNVSTDFLTGIVTVHVGAAGTANTSDLLALVNERLRQRPWSLYNNPSGGTLGGMPQNVPGNKTVQIAPGPAAGVGALVAASQIYDNIKSVFALDIKITIGANPTTGTLATVTLPTIPSGTTVTATPLLAWEPGTSSVPSNTFTGSSISGNVVTFTTSTALVAGGTYDCELSFS